MPTLADLLEYPPPPYSWLLEVNNSFSQEAKVNLWHGLAAKTRSGYKAAQESYKFFCANRGVSAFLAQLFYLIE